MNAQANENNNISLLLKNIVSLTTGIKKTTEKENLKMIIVRTFKSCKPGSKPNQLTGGILGGSIEKGIIKEGDIIEIRPGKVVKDKDTFIIKPYLTKVVSLQSDKEKIKFADPGGLIAIETFLDPSITKSNNLVGNIIGIPGKMSPIATEIKTTFEIFEKSENYFQNAGDLISKKIKIHVLAMELYAIIKKICRKTHSFQLILEKPICVELNQKITFLIENNLVGYGNIIAIKDINISESYIDDSLKLLKETTFNKLLDIEYKFSKNIIPNTNNKTKIIYKENDNCRMYRKEKPNVDNIVSAVVSNIDKINNVIYFKLLEYNDLEAYAILSNVSKKRYIKNLGSIIKVNNTYVMKVIDNLNSIELSKNDVDNIDIEKQTLKYKNSLFVYNLFKKCSATMDILIFDFYNKYGWNLGDEYIYDNLFLLLESNENFNKFVNNHNKEALNIILNELKKNADLSVCDVITEIIIENDSIGGIKNIQIALNEAEKLNSKINLIKIQLISPPLYRIELKTSDRKNINYIIKQILDIIRKNLSNFQIFFDIHNMPTYSNNDPLYPNQKLKDFNYIIDDSNTIPKHDLIIIKNNYYDAKAIHHHKTQSKIENIDIYLVKRKARKFQTKIIGIDNIDTMINIAKIFGKKNSCSSKQILDDKLGNIIIIQGDFCNDMKFFLIENNYCKENYIKIHGTEDIIKSKVNREKNNDLDNLEFELPENISDEYKKNLNLLYCNKKDTDSINCCVPILSYDAKNTKINNFIKICRDIGILSRDQFDKLDENSFKIFVKKIQLRYFIKFIENELTTSSNFTGIGINSELKLKGKFKIDAIVNCIKKYVIEIIKCPICKNITDFEKDVRIYKIFCQKCTYFKFIKL